jgi:hypothetical protein
MELFKNYFLRIEDLIVVTNEEYRLLEFDTMYSGESLPVFRRHMLPLFSALKNFLPWRWRSR